jgi:serine O-acetyltransferase
VSKFHVAQCLRMRFAFLASGRRHCFGDYSVGTSRLDRSRKRGLGVRSRSTEGNETAGVTTSASPPTLKELADLIRTEYRFYKRDWTRPGFRAMAAYRFGVWALQFPRQTLGEKFIGKVLDRIYLAAHRYVRNQHGIELPRRTRVGEELTLAHQGGIVIHQHAVIGDRCLIHQNVTIGNAGRGLTPDQAPIIGNDVELGVGAAILGHVNVGDGARIGANVVVYIDVPPDATLVATSPRLVMAPNTRAAAEARAGKDGEK